MSIILTRYNAFIPELTKPGYFSCPNCYALMKGAGSITCTGCNQTYPVLLTPNANPAPAPTSLVDFAVTAVLSTTTQAAKCPKCAYTAMVTLGIYSVTCPSCKFTGTVSYKPICNACLMNGKKLVAATYLCKDPQSNHTAPHNFGLTTAGKCDEHRCHASCIKL